jgi:3'-phosphoadenosine 5'-phosphosulfate sulfotransferase (PAPS reductase)/FAD synthetase
MSKKQKHVLGLSGGKDSSALALYMNKHYPELEMDYFFTDTGYELQETYDFLNKLKTRLDRPIHYLNPGNSFDYFMKKYNNFLPSATARWCTITMKLKPFEKWIAPDLKEGTEVFTYVGIRYDERGRVGYKPTNPLLKAKFPFIDDAIDREGVYQILNESGLGLPDYYKWRSRSGCSFCFFQRKIEWVNLKEHHPEKFEYAKSLEKSATAEHSKFTWMGKESLEELEKPERIQQIKDDYAKRKIRDKEKVASNLKKNPFLKGEDLELADFMDDTDVSSSCLICHK